MTKALNQLFGLVFIGLLYVILSHVLFADEGYLKLIFFIHEKVGTIGLVLGLMSLVLIYMGYYLSSTNAEIYPESTYKVMKFLKHYSPQVGLLGTVLGAITMLSGLGSDVTMIQSQINELLFGIGMAMYSTAWGLMISMCASILMEWKSLDITNKQAYHG